jgi:sulfur-carrier protein
MWRLRRTRLTGGYKVRADERTDVHIECRFFGPFREAVGEKTVIHETSADAVGDLLFELEAAFPSLEGRLVDQDEQGLAGRTVVTKDTTDVTHLDGLETPLDEESVIRLVPSVYGG